MVIVYRNIAIKDIYQTIDLVSRNSCKSHFDDFQFVEFLNYFRYLIQSSNRDRNQTTTMYVVLLFRCCLPSIEQLANYALLFTIKGHTFSIPHLPFRILVIESTANNLIPHELHDVMRTHAIHHLSGSN